MHQATFYFDLGSPFAYLSAERVDEVLAEPTDGALGESAHGALAKPTDEAPADAVRWQPVSLGALFKLNGRSSWGLGEAEHRQSGMAEVERRASLYGLPSVRWPDPWPGNYLTAMRAATFACRAGRGREFALCALRNAFQEGQDLSIPERVLESAHDAGLDPREVERATQDPEIKLALREATDAAHGLGVFGVPTVAIDGELFWGDDRLVDAAAQLERARVR